MKTNAAPLLHALDKKLQFALGLTHRTMRHPGRVQKGGGELGARKKVRKSFSFFGGIVEACGCDCREEWVWVWCGSGLRNSCSVAAAGVSVLVSGENWWRMMMMMVV